MSADVTAYERLSFGGGDEDHLVLWQEHYRLDDLQIANGLGRRLQARESDLLDLAVAVYVTDRLCPRRPKGARDDGRWWSRRLPVRVALRDPAFWQDSEVDRLLHALLGWLTDDEWEIEVVGSPRDRRWAETQERLFSVTPAAPAQVGLFSGGLDSLLGAATDAGAPDGELILVSAGTHRRLRNLQATLSKGLATVASRTVRSLIVPVGLTAAGSRLGAGDGEQSQRTRGFLFLAFGSVVADAAGVDELRVYENGVGALNLPLTNAQRGAMNTRAMRPETLRSMGELIGRMRDRPFTIANPSFFRTKAEMCASAPSALEPLMRLSVSCDTGLTYRASSVPLCGQCTSCLLRRQALLAGGCSEVDSGDLEQMRGDVLRAPPRRAAPELVWMLNQAAVIERALQTVAPWESLVAEFPSLAKARRALGCSPGKLVDLLSRYVADWRALPAPVVEFFLAPAELAAS